MPDELRSHADRIVETLHRKGFKAYFAGGCVRDMLMGREPDDYDIVTDARPDEVAGLFEAVIPVGRDFGVVVVVIDRHHFEVATFRKEGEYLDGRHPSSVAFTDEEEDARRRDFTINGIFYEPVRKRYIDYVGGQEDILRGVIRSIGDPRERFREDRLRIIRGVRFAARFRFVIDRETEEAIRELAPLVSGVSAERIRDELIKILLDPYPHEGIRLLHTLDVLGVFLPEVSHMDGVEQPPEFHPEGDVLTHTLLMLELMRASPPGSYVEGEGSRDPSAALVMGILLHDIGKPPTMEVADRIRFNNHTSVGAEMAEGIMKRLRFSKKETQVVIDLVRDHLRFMECRNMRESTLKRFLTQENFGEHLELHRLDCLASHGDLSNYEFCREKLDELRAESPRQPRLLTGHDLIRLGFNPGPLYREILTYTEDLQLEGKIRTKEEAIEAVIERFRKGNKDSN